MFIRLDNIFILLKFLVVQEGHAGLELGLPVWLGEKTHM